jgi:hypothetical protein
MGRVLTNGMSLSKAREATLGVLPGAPQWLELEPNSIGAFGNTIGTTTRSPISKARARRKGVVTDLDSAVEVEADFTLTHMRHAVEEFCFSRAVGGDVYLVTGATAVAYQVPALSAAQAGRMIYSAPGAKTLLHAHGYAIAGNNGLKVLGAAVAPGAVTITAAGLAIEAVPANQMAELAFAGVRAAAGDLQINAQGNITSAALNFTTLGLTPGQVIHVGGVDALNRFGNVANFGFARVVAIAANLLTLAKRDQPFVADTGVGVTVDLLFGQFVRNVAFDHVDFLQPSVQFELASPGLMAGNATGYEYALGNWADSLSIAIPLTGKATMTAGYVGQNTTNPSTVRALNAANAKAGGLTAAFGTSSDIARLRVQDVDEAGLTTDFKSATFTLTNNVAGEKVLGRLGPKYLNAGDIEVDVETTLLFTNADVIERIRCNKTVGLDWVLRNGDGGVAFDLPAGTLSGGGRDYPANQSVTLNTTFAAHQDDTLDFTLGVSFFPALPVQVC